MPDTSRVESQVRRQKLHPTDLSVLVRDTLAKRAPADSLRAGLDVDLPERLPWVGLDSGAVREILDELLDDATHAIGDEWGTVSVSTGIARHDVPFASPTYPRDCLLRGLAPGLYVFVEVHDTGAPRSVDLFVARRLMRAQGGALRVDSDPGLGTRVILLFPC